MGSSRSFVLTERIPIMEAMIPNARATRGKSRTPKRESPCAWNTWILALYRPAACAVTNVIAHQVGDDRRVARIILRNSRFHFSHQVSANVCRLGIDTASE